MNMLRKPELRTVVTFHTTSEALKTEQCARQAGLAGRLIPVPQALSAGCGLAWSAPTDTQEELEILLREQGIHPQGLTQLTI